MLAMFRDAHMHSQKHGRTGQISSYIMLSEGTEMEVETV